MLKRTIAAVSFIFIPLVGQAGEYMRTEFVTVQRPRQECWNEQVAVSSSNYGGAVIGGVAGGIIGNQIGGGTGRTVATAVGAMTGAIVGDRISDGGAPASYQNVRRCRTVYEQVQVPTITQVRVVETVVPVYREERVYYVEKERHRAPGHGWHKGWHKGEHKHHKHHKHHRHDEDD